MKFTPLLELCSSLVIPAGDNMYKTLVFLSYLPSIFSGLSRELMPQKAPSKLMLVEIVDKQVVIEWAPVPESSVRGSFRGYLVRTWNEYSSQVYAFSANTSKASVEFFPDSKNFITVSVRNEKYVGPPSEAITFQAPQIEPNQPETFTLHALSNKSIFLKWSKPSRPNGILLGYTVYCSEIKTNTNDSIIKYNELSYRIDNPDKLQAKLTGLSQGIVYRVEISAVNCAGEGERIYRDVKLGPHSPVKPSIPKFAYKIDYIPRSRDSLCYKSIPELQDRKLEEATLQEADLQEPEQDGFDYDYLIVNNNETKQGVKESVTNVGNHCRQVDCLVLWLPDLENYPGEYFYVKYRQRGLNFTFTPPEFNEDFIILHGFDSCKNYEIVLVAEDGDFSTESLPLLTPTVL